MTYNEQFDMAVRFSSKNDWLDEIQLLHEGQPFLRLLTVYRYKTSGLSGDEWRTSCGWQIWEEYAGVMERDCVPFERDPRWYAFDTGYGTLDAGCAALYPGIFSSQPGIRQVAVSSIDFLRKGRLLYRSTHEGASLPLLHCAGHVPWALVMAGDEPLGTDAAWNDMKTLCFQDGCKQEAVSTYQLKQCYDNDGTKRPATTTRSTRGPHVSAVGLIRRFCPLHLRRGDCGLDDADENYHVIDGPGPEAAVGWQHYVSESKLII